MRIPPAEFLALDLEVHGRLKGVPRRLLESAKGRAPLSVRALVGLRVFVGRVFGWDGPQRGLQPLYWAIYVENVWRFTPVYMAAIEPFRRFVVYPAILTSIRKSWISHPS